MKQKIKALLNAIGLLNFIQNLRFYTECFKRSLTGEFRFAQMWNTIQHHHALHSPRPKAIHSPKILSLVLTQDCNLKCEMCVTHSESIDNDFAVPENMTFELFERIIKRYNRAESISFIGNGEPLLHPDLWKMIKLAKKMKFKTLLVTNGTLLAVNSARIVDAGVDSIYISINGHDADDFNRLTGEKHVVFERIKENIREFSKYVKHAKAKMYVGCSYICDTTNMDKLQKMIDLSYDLGANLVVLNNYLDSDVPGFTAQERSIYDTPQYKAIVNSLKIPVLENGAPMTVVLPVPLQENNEDFFCDSFFTMLRVDGDGQLGGCGRKLLDLEHNGNIIDMETWNNDYFIKHREGFIEGSGKEIDEECKTCFSSHVCYERKKAA